MYLSVLINFSTLPQKVISFEKLSDVSGALCMLRVGINVGREGSMQTL
jgi:hypothetical protein